MKLELDPKFEKAWEYANEKMYHIDDVEHVKFCLYEKPSMAARWTKEELDFLLDAWHVIKTGTCAPENKEAECTRPDFDAMTKREIDEWAKIELDIELDRRKNKENMLKDLTDKLGE